MDYGVFWHARVDGVQSWCACECSEVVALLGCAVLTTGSGGGGAAADGLRWQGLGGASNQWSW